jgi:hypothetical protein
MATILDDDGVSSLGNSYEDGVKRAARVSKKKKPLTQTEESPPLTFFGLFSKKNPRLAKLKSGRFDPPLPKMVAEKLGG